MTQNRPLVITAGEPAGVGPELCLALADTPLVDDVVLLADPDVLRQRAGLLGLRTRIREIDHDDLAAGSSGELRVIPERFAAPVRCGQPDPANAQALLSGLRRAVEGCLDGRFSGLVTAPLQKSVINDAGFAFSGHTEFIAEHTGVPRPVMLLVAGELRVALASTHLPLRQVPDFLSQAVVRDVLRVLLDGLRTQFGIAEPRLVVAGLNPHAGEGGHLGSEDSEIIAPVVREFQEQGHAVTGPLPADTVFTATTDPKDAVLAMYHDQGLPVIKYAGFGRAVNVTLGLPIVRTSVDHGTALDIAGRGTADPGSLLAAVRLAAQLAGR